ncbi:hypothetical protein [Komagataeibacter xylinus]|uniref:hypothetical protein n=1 Tax=Komagataeibacter xylinus TaxID=28448 RepID=UPI00280B87FF|nr:hypothetical protein [Komagataeibacter xylinus]
MTAYTPACSLHGRRNGKWKRAVPKPKILQSIFNKKFPVFKNETEDSFLYQIPEPGKVNGFRLIVSGNRSDPACAHERFFNRV